MQSNEQQLIESLFTRLKQAATQSGPRDAAADQLIQQQAQQVPSAPYYMAQALLIQEAAMKQLNNRVSELESQLEQARQAQSQPQQSSGGFLSGLFGGGNSNRQSAPPAQSAWGSAPQPPQYNAQPQYNAPPQAAPRGTGFLGGALQTAVGVAGGVVMADMLTSMFHHSQPQEIVNIINEPPLPDQDFNAADTSFLDNGNGGGWDNNFANNNDDFSGFGDGMDNDFGDDDDSFV